MRILHFAQNVAGGIASYFDEIAPHQIARFGEANVLFLVPAGDRENLFRVPDASIATFTHTERSVLSLTRLALDARQVVESFQPHIVHLHSTFAGVVFRPIVPFLRHRPKVVYCAHGWAFGREQSELKSYVFAGVERLLMPWTDACINISHHEAALAGAAGVPAGKCVTIENGIAKGALSLEVKSPKPSPTDAVRLLFVGRHDPQKGLDILLDAMRQVPAAKFHLDVVGASVVAKSPINYGSVPHNVSILGAVPRARVNELMLVCDALVVPSRWEGFGLVVAEAMRAAKPSVVSPNGALPELVEDGVSGIVVKELTAECLARALRTVTKSMLAEMGCRARARFEQRYTSDVMNASIDELYDAVLAR